MADSFRVLSERQVFFLKLFENEQINQVDFFLFLICCSLFSSRNLELKNVFLLSLVLQQKIANFLNIT